MNNNTITICNRYEDYLLNTYYNELETRGILPITNNNIIPSYYGNTKYKEDYIIYNEYAYELISLMNGD